MEIRDSLFVMIVWDFDDPRYSSTHLFANEKDACDSCRATWPEGVFEFTCHKNGSTSVYEKDHGLIAMIRPVTILSGGEILRDHGCPYLY